MSKILNIENKKRQRERENLKIVEFSEIPQYEVFKFRIKFSIFFIFLTFRL